MAEKIKKYFAKKKTEAKFKLAGPGRKLTDSSESFVGPSKKQSYAPLSSRHPTDATRQAAEAALARLNNQKKDSATFNTSLAAIQAQVRRELEAEKKLLQEGSKYSPPPNRPIETELDASPMLAVKGVYFRCPLISEEVLSKDEWRGRIKEFLVDQLEEERGLTACLMVHSCNYNRTKVTECVDILCKYLENIISNPQETKYHKIRCSNATFNDKVLPIFGATELIYAAGFVQQTLEHNGNLEEFFVYDENIAGGIDTLELLRDALRTADRIELELDRNIQVLSPSQAGKRVELPTAFYSITPEELKREQQLKAEAMEKQMLLRTKAMREKEELREIRKYKFALIRVRFPDGMFLQGTFSVYEKFGDVVDFVQENLENQTGTFILSTPTGHKLEDSDKESSLFDLRLVPATILTFQWASEEVEYYDSYLKPEIMILVQSM